MAYILDPIRQSQRGTTIVRLRVLEELFLPPSACAADTGSGSASQRASVPALLFSHDEISIRRNPGGA